MMICPEQVRAARKLLGLSQRDLALLAGVSEDSIRRFEDRARMPWGASVAAIKRALEDAGIEFLGGLIVRRRPDEASPPNEETGP